MADDTATRTDVNNLRDEIKAEMATKTDLNNLRDEIKAEMATKTELSKLRDDMNAKFDEMKADSDAKFERMKADSDAQFEKLHTLIRSQQTKTELGGEIAPPPAEGVVDENQTILVDNVALFQRFKGRVLIVRTVLLARRNRWKYE